MARAAAQKQLEYAAKKDQVEGEMAKQVCRLGLGLGLSK